TAVVTVLFKLKLVRPSPASIACCVVVGVLLLGGVVVAWTLCAPMSGRVVTTQYVVQLVSYVKGQVLKVHAQTNQPVKKGDLLLEINPVPFQYAVNQATAQLQAAEENVKLAQAGVASAKANVAKSNAAIDQAQASINLAKASIAEAQAAVKKAAAAVELAKADLAIVLNVQKNDAGAVSKQKLEQTQQNLKEKEA